MGSERKLLPPLGLFTTSRLLVIGDPEAFFRPDRQNTTAQLKTRIQIRRIQIRTLPKIKLTRQEYTTFLRERRVNPRAYEAYVEGSFFGSKMSEDSLNKSVALLTQAIELDPNYAQGYAGLSHSYYVIGMLGIRPAGEAYPKAKAAAMKALELDQTVAEAHNTLAEVKRGYD